MSLPLLEKISTALEEKNIDYMVIGGQAVLIYGRPRFTNDIDIIVGIDISQLSKINEICEENKFIKLKDDNFSINTNVVPIFDPISNFRIDLIFSFSDFEKSAIDRAKNIKIKNKSVKFATLEDIIIFKIFASRATDLEDVKNLILMNPDYDYNYIENWLSRFDENPESVLLLTYKNLLKSIT